jgi:acetoacetyl-CoA synthetase
MKVVNEGDLLWTPGRERIEQSQLTQFMRWIERDRQRSFANYSELWQWSVTDIEGFWQAIWDYFHIESSTPYSRVLADRKMPGAVWFPGARLNFAEHALRNEREHAEALLYLNEREPLKSLTWSELGAKVRVLGTQLRVMGVRPGDRVVGYLPNIPEAMIAMLAVTSIGAVWSSCGPDYGLRGVLDRFTQLEPKVLVCVDGYQYGGKAFDRRAEVRQIIDQLGSLRHVIYLPYLRPDDSAPLTTNTVLWKNVLARAPVARDEYRFEQVPFDHPLWILFSSGTTGLPKAIMHGHGGILLEQLKLLHFHMDMHARQRMFFFTTTGWMMWNFLASSLLADVVPVLYDGNPAYPKPDVLWQMVEDSGASFFGASPTYVAILQRAGIVPKESFDLSRLESIMLAGSPVTAEHMQWFYHNVKQDLWVAPGSGGTDVCSGFMGGVVTQPVYAGEIQARQLGVAAYAFNEHGRRIIDEVGELVITEPMPSMPIGFANDPEGTRYRESYFQDFPGVWRHGDFFRVNARGGCFVLGRSDATLNRQGVRIGTAEIYAALGGIAEVEDSLIVNLDLPGGTFFMPLFVKLREGWVLDEPIREKIRATLKTEYSPRHVPDKIYQVDAIPYTLTGKKLEVPVRRILTGSAPEQVVNRHTTANPQALDWFLHYARTQQDYVLS